VRAETLFSISEIIASGAGTAVSVAVDSVATESAIATSVGAGFWVAADSAAMLYFERAPSNKVKRRSVVVILFI
jgi:hypothetical protein